MERIESLECDVKCLEDEVEFLKDEIMELRELVTLLSKEIVRLHPVVTESSISPEVRKEAEREIEDVHRDNR